MIPEGVDIPDLSAQLAEDGVAFSNPDLATNAEIQDPIVSTLQDLHGIAVVDVYPTRLADARDIAQELQDATGLDTVVVQTVRNVSAVSDTYSRAAIEATQGDIPQGVNQVELLDRFYAGVDPFGVPWPLIVAMVVVALVLAGLFVYRSVIQK
ncbi:hypothetical protein Q9G90_10125 [Corynebacterium stationis]|uniref:Rv1476 family membrane protein n=1 Tax=Corynebacterium stationis TaxID=1705 RepID=UPI00261436E8|nr:DUF6676 family protein [Corynebacterium stationis]WLP86664.1 hypothetical protein Q9G90_10125 [Corynebacterium stationis]